MNRSSSRLKPLAPKPDACRPAPFYPLPGTVATNHDGKNMNAFAGSHLGVPAGPLETVTSMDPKDYVWGVPQSQPGLFGGSAFASQPLFQPQGLYHPQAFGLGGYPPASAAFIPGCTAMTGTMAMQTHRLPNGGMELPGFPGVRASAPAVPCVTSQPITIKQPEKEQAGAPLEQMDDLLNTTLDDDCIKKLLGEPSSGPGAVDGEVFGGSLGQISGRASPVREARSPVPSHNSTATVDAPPESLNLDSCGCGPATSSAHEILDATDLHFPMEETSVLESMSGLGDLDLHLLEGGTLGEMETTSPPHAGPCQAAGPNACSVSPPALKRAKSEAGPACHQAFGTAQQADYNPLLTLAVNDALATINDFLASGLSVPEEKRRAAVLAITALQSNACEGAATDAPSTQEALAVLTKSNSFPRRKRSSPRLNGS